MPRELIDSLDDPPIAVYRTLKATNQTRRLNQFVVEGEKLVERLLASRFPPVSVLVTDRHEPRLSASIPADVTTYVVSHDLIDSIVGFPFHRGILGCAEVRPWPPLAEIVKAAGSRLTLVICPKLSNPENLGAIAQDQRRVWRRRHSGRSFLSGSLFPAHPSCVDGIDPTGPVDHKRPLLATGRRPGSKRPARGGRSRGRSDRRTVRPSNATGSRRARAGRRGRGNRSGMAGTMPANRDDPDAPGAGSLNVAVAAGIFIQALTRDLRSGEATG